MATPTLTTPASSLRALRGLADPGRVAIVAGVFLTALLTTLVAQRGLTLRTEALFGVGVFVGLVAGFIVAPWLMVFLTIPLFVVLPMLKVFVSPTLGAVKDVVSLACVAAASVLVIRRRAARRAIRIDGRILLLVAALFALYLANIGGLLTGQTGHGIAWFQGVRLFFEPLGLLVAGLSLRDPKRTLSAAQQALLGSAAVAAAWGIAQQKIGIAGLVGLGYQYGHEVRQIGPHLRSFGTLDEPFTYASLLLLALSVLLLRRRFERIHYALLGLLTVGLLFSYVRTAALIAAAIIGLALARRGHALAAALTLLAATLAAGVVFLASAEKQSTQTVTVNPTTYLTLNGRSKVWQSHLGRVSYWPFGRGVAAVGTAAERAQESLAGKRAVNPAAASATVVDSGYLALVADVGLAGLAVMLGLFARVVVLARRGIAHDLDSAWIALGLVVVMAIDALSRESFTGFPTAYIGMLMLGLALSASAVEARERVR